MKKGNPDRQVAANATRYHRHSVKELEALTPEGWEAYHAGYFNHIVNKNPNYILPLSFLRDLEGKGQIGRVHEWMYALPGVSTPVAMARELGRSIAEDLRKAIAAVEQSASNLDAMISDARPGLQNLSKSTLPEANRLIRDMRELSQALRGVSERVEQEGVGGTLGPQKLPDYKPRKQ